jgi:hypothetical protein
MRRPLTFSRLRLCLAACGYGTLAPTCFDLKMEFKHAFAASIKCCGIIILSLIASLIICRGFLHALIREASRGDLH